MDNLIDTTWMSLDNRRRVRHTFKWGVDEALELLDSVYDDGNGYFGRASYGRGVYWLIVGSEPRGDRFYDLVETAMYRAIDEKRYHAVAMSLILWLFWQKKSGPAALGNLLRTHPELGDHEEVALIRAYMKKQGKMEL